MSKYTKLQQSSTLEQKLHSYTLNGNCWEYNGCINNHGYCLIMVDRKLKYAHRLAWEFWNKMEIPDGMTVDHICFNRKCINPEHLRLATHSQNCGRHKQSQVKTWCEKHNCPRKKVSYQSGKRSICPKCQSENTMRYKKRVQELKRQENALQKHI